MSDETEPTRPIDPGDTGNTGHATDPGDAADPSTASVPPAPDPDTASAPPGSGDRGPRTRWAGIVWGAVFSAIALAVMVIVSSPMRRDAVGDWAGSLTPGGAVLIGVLALGVLALVTGVLVAVRGAQRRGA